MANTKLRKLCLPCIYPLTTWVGLITSPAFFWNNSLTRALEGGGGNALPSGFSRIAEKRRRAAPPFFQCLLRIKLDTLCKNFNSRSPNSSGHQVRSNSKTGFWLWGLRSGHTRCPISFKPSVFHKMIDAYNLYISDFWYLWPEVRSISWPHHYKSMGKNSNRSYWMIMPQNHLNPS